MCGIVGRISKEIKNVSRTLKTLKELEYRGYDSWGILFVKDKGEVKLEKDIGELGFKKIEKLEKIKSNIEIGHTRWATHGKVSVENAHPHFDDKKKFFVVMNGIVENYSAIKVFLEEKSMRFKSQTDTEVIVLLYSYYYFQEEIKDLLEITKIVLQKLEGEFSFILNFENKVLVYKNMNPIIVGKNEKELFFSSDLDLVEKNSKEFYVLGDGELVLCELCEDGIKEVYLNSIFDEFLPSFQKSKKSVVEFEDDCEYYMEKEIFEQRKLSKVLSVENFRSLNCLVEMSRDREIVLLGAGSSYHAALVMHYLLLRKGILSRVILASELKNYLDVLKSKVLVVFSQSGETADLIFPLKKLKVSNEIFAIVNSKNSTLSRFAKHTLYLNCGREVAVASTKAFVFQVFVAELFVKFLDGDFVVSLKDFENFFDDVIERNLDIIEKIVSSFSKVRSCFFIGRDNFYPLALEGALKLKEISYIHAEGFAGGELKHGSIALIENGVPVIVLGEGKEILSNACEIKTRGGVIIGIGCKREEIYDYYLEVSSKFKEIFSIILMQFLSFKMALKLGFNPDKPRNLAKSVTVK